MSEEQAPLTFKERATLALHVMMCAGCRNASEQLPTLRRSIREYARGEHEHVPPRSAPSVR